MTLLDFIYGSFHNYTLGAYICRVIIIGLPIAGVWSLYDSLRRKGARA